MKTMTNKTLNIEENFNHSIFQYLINYFFFLVACAFKNSHVSAFFIVKIIKKRNTHLTNWFICIIFTCTSRDVANYRNIISIIVIIKIVVITIIAIKHKKNLIETAKNLTICDAI